MDAPRLSEFRFTESQWDAISAELERRGRLKNDGDRQTLEMICGHFAQLRPKLGRNQPTPAKARAAWDKVATSAAKLAKAIDGLRAARAADFTFLDNHQGGWKSWLAQLRLLKSEADWAAKIEMVGVRTVTNNADPMLDGFVHRLAMIWREYGGQIAHREDGPLIRFLSAVTAPTLAWIGKKPLTTDALRWSVRRMPAASRAPK